MIGRSLAHHNQNLAILVRRAGGEPFPPVDDVVVAVAPDLALAAYRSSTIENDLKILGKQYGHLRVG